MLHIMQGRRHFYQTLGHTSVGNDKYAREHRAVVASTFASDCSEKNARVSTMPFHCTDAFSEPTAVRGPMNGLRFQDRTVR